MVERELLLSITARRAEVLALVAEQRTEREIAEQLGISPDTVRSHVRWLRDATGTNSMRELGRWWIANREQWREVIRALGGTEDGWA